jgi:hypothetical protein
MKTIVQPVVVASAGALAVATTYFTLPELFDFYGISLQVEFVDSGSLAGALTLEVSNTGVNYYAHAGFASIAAPAATMWALTDKIFPYKYARLKWVGSAGSGTVTVTMCACRV